MALKGADVALVIGVPLDFRLGFGGVFGEETTAIVFLDGSRAGARTATGELAAELYGALPEVLDGLAGSVLRSTRNRSPRDRGEWLRTLRAVEDEQRKAERGGPDGWSVSPLHPAARVCRARAAARPRRDRDR